MLAGTGSDVGKSVLAAAFCRILKQDGYTPCTVQGAEYGIEFLRYSGRTGNRAGASRTGGSSRTVVSCRYESAVIETQYGTDSPGCAVR